MARRLEERLLFAEADAKMETALRLDPDSWDVNREIARVYLRDGRIAEAVRYFERAVSLMESDVQSWARLVTCYHALGDGPRMRKAAETAVAQAELETMTPLGRLLEPSEVAAAVLFLASPEAAAINGQTLVLDGGGLQA